MINKDIIKTISDKEMDRKDFLKYSGLVLAAVVGLRTVVNVLTDSYGNEKTKTNSSQVATRGFGGGRYGV